MWKEHPKLGEYADNYHGYMLCLERALHRPRCLQRTPKDATLCFIYITAPEAQTFEAAMPRLVMGKWSVVNVYGNAHRRSQDGLGWST